MYNVNISKAESFDFDYSIGWRYYNKIKKKAMEQEFSYAGLAISLSIAFFIVIISSFSLRFAYESMVQPKELILRPKIYILEKGHSKSYKKTFEVEQFLV